MKIDRKIVNVLCDYCQQPAELVTGDVIYPHRSDLADKHIWRCEPCGAWVGTHDNSLKHAPLGRLANAELREWKQKAHAAFDPLWKAKIAKEGCSKSKARKAGYQWLADQIGIHVADCHIGMFDVEQCKAAVGAIKGPA